jgi:hypothetical protein
VSQKSSLKPIAKLAFCVVLSNLVYILVEKLPVALIEKLPV